MTSEELREIASRGEDEPWYGPSSTFTEAINAAADTIDRLSHDLLVAAEFRQALEARVAELEADAKRYRWLRLHPVWQREVMADRGWFDSDDAYDAAIDAAIAAGGE